MKRRTKINFRGYSSSGSPGPGNFDSRLFPVVLAKWLILTAAVFAAAYMLENIRVSGFLSAFFAAAAIGLLNLVLRPVLLILTLPINIMTLGLFTFVINAMMLKIASAITPGFDVYGFWTTIFGSITISIVSWILNSLLNDARRPGSGQGPAQGRRGGSKDHIDLEYKGDRWE